MSNVGVRCGKITVAFLLHNDTYYWHNPDYNWCLDTVTQTTWNSSASVTIPLISLVNGDSFASYIQKSFIKVWSFIHRHQLKRNTFERCYLCYTHVQHSSGLGEGITHRIWCHKFNLNEMLLINIQYKQTMESGISLAWMWCGVGGGAGCNSFYQISC